jgi:uncharacterized circularly permuted ATP-grasp superfamily protein
MFLQEIAIEIYQNAMGIVAKEWLYALGNGIEQKSRVINKFLSDITLKSGFVPLSLLAR